MIPRQKLSLFSQRLFVFSKVLEKIQIVPQQSQHPFHLRKMGNKTNMRSRRLETPIPDGDLSGEQVETPKQGNETLTNVNTVVQESLGGDETRPQLVESSQISNAFQAWTENFEQKINGRILKTREEMGNKVNAILKEIRINRSATTITEIRSEMNGIQNLRDPKMISLMVFTHLT